MNKLKLSSLLLGATLFFSANTLFANSAKCGGDAKTEKCVKDDCKDSKCGAKCGSDKKVPTAKCGAKCGGDEKKVPASKCGVGKCG